MHRALLFKEFRELWWGAAIALLILLLWIADALGVNYDSVSQRIYLLPKAPYEQLLGGPLVEALFVSCGLGAALALWQTLGESLRGTWAFLLHRPVPRRTVVAAKLIAGMTLLALAYGLPVVLYGVWAATSGAHASPFAWWMMITPARAWFATSIAYLSVFLFAQREARWLGSRLFPLVPGGFFVFVYFEVMSITAIHPIVDGVVVAMDALLVAAILQASRQRDY